MFTYQQSTGKLTNPNGDLVGVGYSGLGDDKNVPASQDVAGKGPIPLGYWRATSVINAPDTGPFSILLEPIEGNECFGRSGFRMHGDSLEHPGEASHGCIIMPRITREVFWRGDHMLKVIE